MHDAHEPVDRDYNYTVQQLFCIVLLSIAHTAHMYMGSSDMSNIPQLKVLLRELRQVADEWKQIGTLLHIEQSQLMQIKFDNPGDSAPCLREMMRAWLSRVAPSPSWSAMADALDILGYQDIATRLRLHDLYSLQTSAV